MRITTAVSTAGESGYMGTPRLSKPAEEYVLPNGMLDESKVRAELARTPGIQIGSNDDYWVFVFAAELLDRMRIAMERLMAKDPTVHTVDDDTPKSTAQRRYDRGSVAYVRLSVYHVHDGISVHISATNPREVVGHAEEFARVYAQAFADNIVIMQTDCKELLGNIHIVELEGCTGVTEEARSRILRTAMRRKHGSCIHRYGNQCANNPDMTCELYSNGKCRYEEVCGKEA